jgi:hypothetical protein
MIGEYSDEDFIKKLTTEEQRQYLITVTEKMTNKQAWDLVMAANEARAKAVHNHVEKKEGYIDIPFDHFF